MAHSWSHQCILLHLIRVQFPTMLGMPLGDYVFLMKDQSYGLEIAVLEFCR